MKKNGLSVNLKYMRNKLIIGAVFLVFGLILFVYGENIATRFFAGEKSSLPSGVNLDGILKEEPQKEKDVSEDKEAEEDGAEKTEMPGEIEVEEIKDIEILAENLEIPWEVVFLPNGEILITERPGNLVKIRDGNKIPVNGVEHVGEGGLLGMALHPDFAENNRIYLYLTTESETGLINRVESYELKGNELVKKEIIFDNIPGARYHDGGRIAFGPDGYLYILTGDATDENSAQDLNSLAGKILRIKDDGQVAKDNPYNNAIFSYGHRNPQGITWDETGRIWATEHGRSGVLSGFDELNLIEKGQNYGWPEIQGDEVKEDMVKPVAHSGANETWAPADAAFLNNSVFFTGLRGESLYQARLNENGELIEIISHFNGDFGRLRAVVAGPDNLLYITTSNTDGRGNVKPGDDKLIRINPEIFTRQ